MSRTSIEWTDETWNPVTGCSHVSEGCRNCYAERFMHRWRKDHKPWTAANAAHNVTLHPERLEQPLHGKKPRRVFVNSMSDLFHEAVPDEFIEDVFSVMALAPQHTFQILTKRPKRMLEWMNGEYRDVMIEGGAQKRYHERTGEDPSEWLAVHLPLANVWLGVSVEDQETFDERSKYLADCPAAVRFISYEPALGPIYARDLRTLRIDWLICGGESGPRARPMHPDWARSIRDQCEAAGVPFFFKQWGEWAPAKWIERGVRSGFIDHSGQFPIPQNGPGVVDQLLSMDFADKAFMAFVGKKRAGRSLDGVEHKEYPEAE